MKQKGGMVFSNWSGVDLSTQAPRYIVTAAAMHFISNIGACELFTWNTTACISLKIILADSAISPYVSTRPTSAGTEIRTILLKLFIAPDESDIKDIIPSSSDQDSVNFFKNLRPHIDPKVAGTFEVTDESTFNNEVKIQYDLYNKSYNSEIDKYDPFVPAILFSKYTLEPEFKEYLRNTLLRTLPQNINVNNMINWYFNENISMIGMELLDGYVPFSSLEDINPELKKYYVLFALFELLKIYIFGYSHGDFNKSNIMINTSDYHYGVHMPTQTDPFKIIKDTPIPGRIIIIDFGKSRPVSIGLSSGSIKDVFLKIIKEHIDTRRIDEYLEIIDSSFNTNTIMDQAWFFKALAEFMTNLKERSLKTQEILALQSSYLLQNSLTMYTKGDPSNMMMTGGNKNRKKHKNTSIFIPLTPSQYRLKNTILLSSVKIKAKTTKEKKTTTKKKK